MIIISKVRLVIIISKIWLVKINDYNNKQTRRRTKKEKKEERCRKRN